MVKSHRSAPIEQDLLSRYQPSLDNELYKAIRALREAQQWRLKAIDSTGQPISDSEATGS